MGLIETNKHKGHRLDKVAWVCSWTIAYLPGICKVLGSIKHSKNKIIFLKDR